MEESPREIARKVGRVQLKLSPISFLVYLSLALAGVIFWTGPLLFYILVMQLGFGGALYAGSYVPIRRKVRPLPLKMEPYTRTPSYDQCPVCGIADLGEYRYKDQFLALTGDERYVQKWGSHDAHWSCVITCPYIPSQEEIYEREHKDGKHTGDSVDYRCEACLRRRERREAEEDDRVNPLPGCRCHACIRKQPFYALTSYSLGYLRDEYEFTRRQHYELMATQFPPGSVRYAYAIEMIEKEDGK